MVPQHEIAVRWDDRLRVGTLVCVDGRYVVFFKLLAVHVHLAGINSDDIARHSYHPLDIAGRRIPRVAKYYDISALDRFPAVDELIDEDAFLVVERRHHAGAFDLHRLVQEDDDERRNGEGNYQVAQPDGEHGSFALDR